VHKKTVRHQVRATAAALSLLALAACAPSVPTAAARQDTRPTTAKPRTASTGKADCSRASKVTIVKKSTGYAFSPAALTVQRGAFLAVINKSDAAHRLLSSPDAGIVKSVIDLEERQVVQFPQAGTFAVKAGDAVLRLTVAGDSGCGSPDPALTIGGTGRFTPSTATVRATENFAVVNKSGTTQSVTCTPGSSKDHTRLDDGETQILAIDEPGSYVCASLQHPGTRISVTVTK
jgi:plastocyanin